MSARERSKGQFAISLSRVERRGRDGRGSGDPGGGGGSTGFFQTYTPTGVSPVLTPIAASPPFETNRNVPTR